MSGDSSLVVMTRAFKLNLIFIHPFHKLIIRIIRKSQIRSHKFTSFSTVSAKVIAKSGLIGSGNYCPHGSTTMEVKRSRICTCCHGNCLYTISIKQGEMTKIRGDFHKTCKCSIPSCNKIHMVEENEIIKWDIKYSFSGDWKSCANCNVNPLKLKNK